MKKMFKLALMSAAAVLSLGFASCVSDDVAVVDNPNYNPETKEVTTDFVFNISMGNTATTRMTDANTQATVDQKFRGMENVHLLTFKQNADGKYIDAATTASRDFDLAQLLSAGEITKDASHRIIELALPLGTNTLMFYGNAPRNDFEYQQGSVTAKLSDNLSDISFETNPIFQGDKKEEFEQSALLLNTILTRIVQNGLHKEVKGENGNNEDRDLRISFWWPTEGPKGHAVKEKGSTNPEVMQNTDEQVAALEAEVNSEGGNKTWVDPYGNEYTYYKDYSIEWKDLGDEFARTKKEPAEQADLNALEEILGEAFYSFTTIKEQELRAGSAEAILRMVADLWAVTTKVSAAEPTSAREYVAQKLGDRIATRFSTYFKGETTGDKGTQNYALNTGTVEYKPVADIVAQVVTYVYGMTADKFTAIQEGHFSTFPRSLDLPMGSTQLSYDAAKNSFSHVENLPIFGMGGDADATTNVYETYRYPAELYYFGNSPIWVTDESHVANDYPNGVTDWDEENNWKAGRNQNTQDWKVAHVVSSTRSVAMKNDINYGVANLKTTVKYGDTELEDNRNGIFEDEENQKITVTDTSFKLTGVVVGGQPSKVGWNYLPVEDKFDYLVFDHDVPNEYIPESGTSTPNYTLLWDNYNKTLAKDAQSPVYVALEFENNSGLDIWGGKNLIRQGGRFYIIGKLDPTKATGSLTQETSNHPLPPYGDGTDSAKGTEAKRVFIQDFMTTANFIFGKNSLASAYVTVPDLRSSQITLGLSVDIQWSTGMEFNVTLGATE